MKTAKTQAQFDKIRKTLSGKEKKLGIKKFYEALLFDPKKGFSAAELEFRKTHPLHKGPSWGVWGDPMFVEKGYKHQVENFVKGYLTYYELWDGGSCDDHTVFFEWKKFKTGFNLNVWLKPWWNNPFPGKINHPNPWGFSGGGGSKGGGGSDMSSPKRDPIPGPPQAGVDPPKLPPIPPPSKS